MNEAEGAAPAQGVAGSILGNEGAAPPPEAPKEGGGETQPAANGNANGNGADPQPENEGFRFKTHEEAEKGWQSSNKAYQELDAKYKELEGQMGSRPESADAYLSEDNWKPEELAKDFGVKPEDLGRDIPALNGLAKAAFEGEQPLTQAQFQSVVKGMITMDAEVLGMAFTAEQQAKIDEQKMASLGPNWETKYADTRTFLKNHYDGLDTQGKQDLLVALNEPQSFKAIDRVLKTINKSAARPTAPVSIKPPNDGKGLEYWRNQVSTEKYGSDKAFRSEVEANIRAYLDAEENI